MAHDHEEHEHEHSHHGHGHHHSHAAQGEQPLLISIVLNIIITAAEIAGGIISGSLALLSDAIHNLSDVVSLIISYFAILIGKREKNRLKTYGYKRAEIIAAMFNVITLFIICGYIVWEAVQRFSHPQPINARLMLAVAVLGLAGNGISVLLLFRDAKDNINVKSAFLHLLADTVSSVGVIITAVILLFRNWPILDTVISIAIALYIIKESFSILSESLNILMQGAPQGLDREKIKTRILTEHSLRIKSMHHIHMWDITPGRTVFDAHIVVEKADLNNADSIIHGVNKILASEFHICHSTIQIESGDFNHCVSCDL